MASPIQGILERVAARVRTARREAGLSARQLAEAAGLSVRFVAQVEAGRGNIAISRLQAVADALGVPVQDLVAEPRREPGARGAIGRMLEGRSEEELAGAVALLAVAFDEPAPRAVALAGMRGAGKSSVGPRLARRLGVPFVELDDRIEDAAGLSLSEIFALHGEAYFRRLEARCFADVLAAATPSVVALPGGFVTNEDAWELARRYCLTVWLRARPEDHMRRVLDQGDRRPVEGRDDAMAELEALLERRRPLYGAAQLTVDTSAAPVDAVVDALVPAARSVIRSSTADR